MTASFFSFPFHFFSSLALTTSSGQKLFRDNGGRTLLLEGPSPLPLETLPPPLDRPPTAAFLLLRSIPFLSRGGERAEGRRPSQLGLALPKSAKSANEDVSPPPVNDPGGRGKG